MSCNREMFKVGPIGSKGKTKSWDEKGHTKISNIYISFDEYYIKSIQFSYFQNGGQVVSKKYGSSKGRYFRIVRLNGDEYVTGLSGIVDLSGDITSLSIDTNQRKYGPFCVKYRSGPGFDTEKKCKREIDVEMRDRSEFGGFFGSFCDIKGSLTSIGIYVCPIPITSCIDLVPQDRFETEGDHQFIGYHGPKIVHGFPVKPVGYKAKLKSVWLSFRSLFG